MKNLGAILRQAGTDYTKIVKTTIFLTDMNDFAAVNKIYESYFGVIFRQDPVSRVKAAWRSGRSRVHCTTVIITKGSGLWGPFP